MRFVSFVAIHCLLTYLLTYLLTLWSRVLLHKLTRSQLVKDSLHFREPEGSLPLLQVPTNRPYPEPDQSSPWPLSRFLKNHFNIILPSMPGSSKWSRSLSFPHYYPVCTSPFPHTCYMPRSSRSSRFDHSNNIW